MRQKYFFDAQMLEKIEKLWYNYKNYIYIRRTIVVGRKRKFDFEEQDYCFDTVLYSIKSNDVYVNNFAAYMQSIADGLPEGEDKETYEKRIRLIKKKREVANIDIALILGKKSSSSVDRWLAETTGDIKIPNITVLPKLSKAFGVSTDYLLGLVEDYTIDKTEYPTLNKLGVDIDLLKRMYNEYYDAPEGFENVLRGLELLLTQKEEPFSIIENIGNYLTISIMRTGLFFSELGYISIEKLVSEVIENPPIDIYKFLSDYFKNEKSFAEREVAPELLKHISSELEKYRVKLLK